MTDPSQGFAHERLLLDQVTPYDISASGSLPTPFDGIQYTPSPSEKQSRRRMSPVAVRRFSMAL